jgi:cell division protein FtsQ
LEILLEEHVALAHWDSRALVNVYGEVFHAATNDKLPVFIGPAEENALLMAQSYASFRKILLPLQQTITELSLSPRYAWRIRLDTGSELELGREQVAARLSNYASIYNHSIAHLNQQAPLAYIDLRYPNGFAVRMPETIQQKSHKSGMGKET